MQTPYETMFLLPSATPVEKVDELIDRLKKSVEKKHGEVSNVDKMGVRKTAYEIRHQNSAYYVLIQFRGNGETIREMERTLKNSEVVLKYLSTKVTTKAPVIPKHAAPVEPKVEEAAVVEEKSTETAVN